VAGIALLSSAAGASDYLLYLEAQGVAGYSNRTDEPFYYSWMADEVMQKPSLGLDFLKRLSSEAGDFGSFALQYRLAWDDPEDRFQSQLYNAWFKYKADWSDLWLGHNRPAMGLASVFDTHGLLLPTLPMYGFGFDRDWGAGGSRDLDWGNISLSLTTGSGMPVRFDGNYLATARVSRGVLNQDNYSLGASLSSGQILGVMGYEVIDREPRRTFLGGVDLTFLRDLFETRAEFVSGRNRGERTTAVFLRQGINLMDEGRLKLEIQPTSWQTAGKDQYAIASGASFQANGDLALRFMHVYDGQTGENRFVVQAYGYKKM
jgi:hypothetical protein